VKLRSARRWVEEDRDVCTGPGPLELRVTASEMRTVDFMQNAPTINVANKFFAFFTMIPIK
jgi:hypothetical protein